MKRKKKTQYRRAWKFAAIVILQYIREMTAFAGWWQHEQRGCAREFRCS
jgi:hypothetical protein